MNFEIDGIPTLEHLDTRIKEIIEKLDGDVTEPHLTFNEVRDLVRDLEALRRTRKELYEPKTETGDK